MRTRTATGSYAVGRARRVAIVDAATQHFVSAGYFRTPMATIAADVGLSERGLLHHFPTKKHLLLAVAERRFDFVHQWIADIPEADDGTRALRALLNMTGHFLEQPGLIELFVLVTAECADQTSPAYALFSAQYERAVSDMTRDFESDVAVGKLSADIDYEIIARRCIAMCDGLQLQWVLSGRTLDLMGELRAYLDELSASLVVTR
jgi:AcrR family transcriptional regulator